MELQDNKNINFLLADDHSIVRHGLEFLIEELLTDFETSHASNLKSVLETVKEKELDIAIIDAHFPDGNSLNIIGEIKSINPDLKILIYTGIDEQTHSLKFIKAGANGFLSKLSEESEIKNALSKIINDGEYLSPSTQTLLLNSIHGKSSINPLENLSERESEIAKLYAKGLGNLEIANLLDIKQNTVSTLKKRIFEKLNVDNLVELIELIKNHE
ncbi:response regulator transcription factor [Soonwooa sp.]|uniref:response regulator n=1 Tax=Soonwooa sp. TaxID=1938592 RepID=UPI00262AAF89|nr:response regulator transcription factor [Soonwooa sp.]